MLEKIDVGAIAQQINTLNTESEEAFSQGIQFMKRGVELAKETGDLLIKVKNSLPHGEFTNWIKNNCKFSDRRARQLISIASNWQRISECLENSKTESRFRSEENFTSIRDVLKIVAAIAESQPKQLQLPLEPEQPKVLVVASIDNPNYGEKVEVVKRHNDYVIGRTSTGDEVPFFNRELISEGEKLPEIKKTEIIDVEIIDLSEDLQEAIALIIQYLSEDCLKALLVEALKIGRDKLPEDTRESAIKLVGRDRMLLESAA